MKCHQCGGEMKERRSDLPFKTGDHSLLLLKELPVHQCGQCGEYLLDDAVMAWVEKVLAGRDKRAELEVLSYAA